MLDSYLVVSSQARFERLYRVHAPRVQAYVVRRVGAEAADDVVADVFVVAWRRLDNVPEEPLPWLLGVARRVLANRRRGESRASALIDRLALEPHESDVGAVAIDERVIRALGRLRERDRELLMLIAWEGFTHAEVAHVLGVRRGTVAVRLHRARQQFAEALAAEDALMTTEVSR
jgi:RNA polymerase sigma-70 factor, ECF subfamily